METLKKIVRYICKDRLRTIIVFFLSIHIFYSVAFLIANVDVGNTIHMIAAFVYIVLLVQLRDGESRLRVFTELLMQVLIFTVASTYILGWDAGFGMFLLVMIPGMFFIGCDVEKPEWYNGIASMGLLFSFWVLIRISDWFASETALKWSHYKHQCYVTNAFFAALLLLCFGVAFEMEIQRIEINLKDKNLMLIQMASHDALTNLFNRRVMNDLLQKAANVKKEYGRDYSVCICDIDDFKKINDTYGHDCGDYVLKEVARLLVENSKTDQVARWGGEEFLILLKDMTAADSFSIVNDVRRAISEYSYDYSGQKITVTMTFGMSHSKYMNGKENMLLQADSRLYEGKQSGKNCVKA